MGLLIEHEDDQYISIPGRSTFLFATRTPISSGFLCIFAVIVKDPAHMAFMQDLVIAHPDVKDHIVYLGSMLGYGDVDKAHGSFKPIHFIDFVIDCVNPEFWINDIKQLKRFMSGMSESDKQYALKKASLVRNRDHFKNIDKYVEPLAGNPGPRRGVRPPKLTSGAPKVINVDQDVIEDADSKRDMVESGLKNLGFKKPRIREFMKNYNGDYQDPSKVMVEAIAYMNRS